MMKYILLLCFLTYTFQIDHCIKSTYICTKCESSFLVYDYYRKYCSKIEHCTVTSDSEDKCFECEEAYRRTIDDNCEIRFQIIDNCISYNTDNQDAQVTTCRRCDLGYALSHDKKQCIEFANCEELKEGNTKCEKCRDSYQLNSAGICEISTCSELSNNNTCQDCVEGFYLDSNNKCQQIPIQYCETGNATSCFHCNEAAKKDGDKCVLREEIRQCDEYSDDGKKCNKCSDGFTPSEDKTQCILKYCKEKREYCDVCEDGYFSDGTSCKPYIKKVDKSSFINFNYVIIMILFSVFYS